MSWRKTYTGYSIGCAVVWAVILSVVAVVYREPGQRERHQYLLTKKGHDLFAALVVLMHWGDRWEAAPQGGPVVVRHRDCGEPLHVELRCAHDHRVFEVEETESGPRAGLTHQSNS